LLCMVRSPHDEIYSPQRVHKSFQSLRRIHRSTLAHLPSRYPTELGAIVDRRVFRCNLRCWRNQHTLHRHPRKYKSMSNSLEKCTEHTCHRLYALHSSCLCVVFSCNNTFANCVPDLKPRYYVIGTLKPRHLCPDCYAKVAFRPYFRNYLRPSLLSMSQRFSIAVQVSQFMTTLSVNVSLMTTVSNTPST
jgi:hypothetical protein